QHAPARRGKFIECRLDGAAVVGDAVIDRAEAGRRERDDLRHGADDGVGVAHLRLYGLRCVEVVSVILRDADVNAIVRDTLGVVPEGARLGAERFGRGGDDVPNVVHATPVVLTVVRVVRISPVWWDDTVRHDYLWVTGKRSWWAS